MIEKSEDTVEIICGLGFYLNDGLKRRIGLGGSNLKMGIWAKSTSGLYFGCLRATRLRLRVDAACGCVGSTLSSSVAKRAIGLSIKAGSDGRFSMRSPTRSRR